MFKNKKFRYAIIIFIVLILGISFYMANTYGFFEYFKKGVKQNTIRIENIVLELDDSTSLGIDRNNAYPLSDEAGRNLDPYVFRVNNLGLETDIKIKLVNDTAAIENDNCADKLLSESSIRYQIIKDGNILTENILSTSRVIYEDTVTPGEHEYELRVWIYKYAEDIANKHFHGKLEIEV